MSESMTVDQAWDVYVSEASAALLANDLYNASPSFEHWLRRELQQSCAEAAYAVFIRLGGKEIEE